MNRLVRRLTAVAVAVFLVVLIVCDLSIVSFRTWWERHSLTGSIVSNLLVLAVTGLIVDEIVARRQRKERSTFSRRPGAHRLRASPTNLECRQIEPG